MITDTTHIPHISADDLEPVSRVVFVILGQDELSAERERLEKSPLLEDKGWRPSVIRSTELKASDRAWTLTG